eukprot:m.233364 g.233364  ORF g.233364 m.233364 type:complete len:217 (-) comp33640_c3_seq17:102-752(-)
MSAPMMFNANSADQAYTRGNILFQEVKNSLYSGTSDADIETKLQHITTWLEKADQLIHKEPTNRRPIMRQKIDQLKFNLQDLYSAQEESERKRLKTLSHANRRKQLMERKFEAHDEATYLDMFGADMAHNDKLLASESQADILNQQGATVLGELRAQRDRMKGMQRKVIDIVNTLGLSNTVMKLIEQRTMQDKVILFGGMGVTLFLMYMSYSYIKG